jgi:FMN phosphatase YigB (HAD superfamily)
MIVYLDLDRTLFRTGEASVIWQAIAALYPEVDVSNAFEDRASFFKYLGDQYYYDMSQQLQSYGLESESVYEQLRASDLTDGRFEYEGVHELILALKPHAEVRIFTFGADDYQRFKASLCPSLHGLTIVTTLRAKGDVLADSEEECWLVDDRPIGDELPGNASFVQVSLEGKDVPPDALWPVFRSLGDLQVFLADLFED